MSPIPAAYPMLQPASTWYSNGPSLVPTNPESDGMAATHLKLLPCVCLEREGSTAQHYQPVANCSSALRADGLEEHCFANLAFLSCVDAEQDIRRHQHHCAEATIDLCDSFGI